MNMGLNSWMCRNLVIGPQAVCWHACHAALLLHSAVLCRLQPSDALCFAATCLSSCAPCLKAHWLHASLFALHGSLWSGRPCHLESRSSGRTGSELHHPLAPICSVHNEHGSSVSGEWVLAAMWTHSGLGRPRVVAQAAALAASTLHSSLLPQQPTVAASPLVPWELLHTVGGPAFLRKLVLEQGQFRKSTPGTCPASRAVAWHTPCSST